MTTAPWCPLPWTHLGVKNNGTLRMCSHSQSGGNKNTVLTKDGRELTIDELDTVDVLNADNLKQVRKDFLEGNWPDQCRRCRIESAAGHRSRDQWETLRHLETFTKDRALEITNKDGSITESQIQSYDLRLGNPCNLRCVMCFPGEATKWYKDYKEIIGDDTFVVDNKTYSLNPKDSDFDWVRSEEKVASLIRASGNLNKIKFGGGEPLMIKKHYDLIKGLIEAGYSHNIELEYSSNVTIFPEELFELWKHFKIIKICASVDAIGSANEAIRYPSKWNTIVSNLKMLDSLGEKFTVFTSTTISTLSIEHFANTMIWLQEQNFKKINKDVYSISASHPVYAPYYQNIAILEEYQEERIFNNLRKQINDTNFDVEIKNAMLGKIEFYHQYYKKFKIDGDAVNTYRKQFAERFYKFAKNQNQDWASIFPQAAQVVSEWTK